MEFTFVTDYDQKAFTALARVLRKANQSVMSIVSRAICRTFLAMMLLGGLFSSVLFIFIEGEAMPLETLLMGLPCMVILLLVIIGPILFGDYLSGFLGRKQMMRGIERSTAVFSAESYTVMTNAAKTEYRYDAAVYISETKDYFVFVMSRNQGLFFNKSSISGGTVEEFRTFIEERTNKKLLKV